MFEIFVSVESSKTKTIYLVVFLSQASPLISYLWDTVVTSSALHSGPSMTWPCFPLSDFSHLSSPFSSSAVTYVSLAPGVFLSLFLEMPFSRHAPPLPRARTPSCGCLEDARAAVRPPLTATGVASVLPTAPHVCWVSRVLGVSSPARIDALEWHWVSSSTLFLQYLTRCLLSNNIIFAFFYLKIFELAWLTAALISNTCFRTLTQ